MRSRVLLVTVFMVFLFGNILIEGSVYVSAEPSIEISNELREYIAVDPGNSDYRWVKITGESKWWVGALLYYVKVKSDKGSYPLHPVVNIVYAPDGSVYKGDHTVDPPTSCGISGCVINPLWPGEWRLVNKLTGFTIRFNVPPLVAKLDEDFNLVIVSPSFISGIIKDESLVKISLLSPRGEIVNSGSPSEIKSMIKKNVQTPGKWEVKVEVVQKELLEKGVHNEYSIPLVAYANPVIVESPSEIESLAKESDDYFTIHFRNEEDSTRGDYLVDLPCSDFKAGLYDPNGVSYDTTTATRSGEKCAIKLKVPDKARPGYWKIVVYPKDHREYSTSVEFYVSPEKERQVSVNATCGPASIFGLALIPLGLLGMRRRKNN